MPERSSLRRSDILAFAEIPILDFLSEKYHSLLRNLDYGPLATSHYFLWRSMLDEDLQLHVGARKSLYELSMRYSLTIEQVCEIDLQVSKELINLIVEKNRNSPKAIAFYTFEVARSLKNIGTAEAKMGMYDFSSDTEKEPLTT